MIKNKAPIRDIDGAALKNARIRLGASKAGLAKQLCLSVAHIDELEGDNLKIFFNYRHKYFTALKLAKLLGLSEVDIFKSRLGSDQAVDNPINAAMSAHIGINIAEKNAAEIAKKSEFAGSGAGKLSKRLSLTRYTPFAHSQKIFLLLTFAGAIFLGAGFLFGFDRGWNFSNQNLAKTDQEEPQAPADQALAEKGGDQPSSIAATLPTPGEVRSMAPNNVPITANIAEANCQKTGDAHAVQFTPIAPLKPSNFVYIQASQPSALCIEDNTGKLVRLNLDSNESRVVAVKAPLTIFSSNFSSLQIYFQGHKVGGLEKTANELILNPVVFVQQEDK